MSDHKVYYITGDNLNELFCCWIACGSSVTLSVVSIYYGDNTTAIIMALAGLATRIAGLRVERRICSQDRLARRVRHER